MYLRIHQKKNYTILGRGPSVLSFRQNLTYAIFSNPLSQPIYILPALRRDTHIDHIYGHINHTRTAIMAILLKLAIMA